MTAPPLARAPQASPPKAAAFDPHIASGPDAYEQWRAEALIPRVFEVTAEPDRFRSRVEYRGLGSVVALQYEMSASHHLRTGERARRDGLDMIWVQLSRTGGFAGSSPGRDVTAGPGAGGFCDFSVPVEQHSLASTGTALLIPREAFEGCDPRALHGAAVADGRYALLDGYVRWLCAHAGRRRVRSAEATARAVGQVVAACFGSSALLGVDIAGELGPVALRRARTFVAGRLAEPELRTNDIARAAGVSRATLYRLCAPLGGVAELVWSMRLEATRRALNDPGRTAGIAEIAESYGFTSPQHFSRRFRQTYGFSPRDLRPL